MAEATQQALRAVALMGPTASGKSALAMRLARETGASIVCCDSMQVYRGLDIGTAKPTPAEQAEVRHAMLDCCVLPEVFSAARWAEGATVFIQAENRAGRTPLIVGGTGLYLRALAEGLAGIPAEKPEVRQALQAQCAAEGIEALHAELMRVDAATASRLHAADTQRILRALAVYRSSGRPLSHWLNEERTIPAHDIPVFVLDLDRQILAERIEERFSTMLDAGWLDEVRRLAGLGLPDTHPAMRAVGYRQLLAHLRGACSLEEALEKGVTATRRYAKRQRTWFLHQTPEAVHGDAEALVGALRAALRASAEALA